MPQVGIEPTRLVTVDAVPICLDPESSAFTITPLGRVKNIPGFYGFRGPNPGIDFYGDILSSTDLLGEFFSERVLLILTTRHVVPESKGYLRMQVLGIILE